MKIPFSPLLIAFVSLVPLQGHAADQPCDHSPASILECLKDRSPSILRAGAQREEARAVKAQAGERINPQMNMQAQKSMGSDPSGDSVQASLLFPWDWHGVRRIKGRLADAEFSEKEAAGTFEIQQILISAYLSLHRIRQMKAQAEILKGTLDSITQALETYKKRPQLSPIQAAEMEVLAVSKEETSSHLTLVEQELHAFEHDIEIALGQPWEPSEKNLPPGPTAWPELTAQNPNEENPVFAKWKFLESKLNAQSELIQAEKKPMLWLGPSAEWSQVGSQNGVRVGLALQMPLPILESHHATAALAERMRATAAIQAQTQKRESLGEWAHNTEIYNGAKQALLSLETSSQWRKRVLKLDQLFKKGLISGAVYIEGLRQTFSLKQNHDDLESKALGAWCQLQVLQNHYEGCFL